jgi:enoyl-CoA hydratase/carnithine racemase
MTELAGLSPSHFLWEVQDRVATIRLNRPDRKNPLTFDSYAELRDTFRALVYATDVDVVVLGSNGGNFCSGGDVHDIIGPLVGMDMKGLLAFTRMTGDLVKAMIGCGKPIIAAVDGVCVGAGAIMAMASDLRLATPGRNARSCSRASGLPAATWGPAPCCPGSSGRAGRRSFFTRARDAGRGRGALGVLERAASGRGAGEAAMTLARQLAAGPTFAHGITKTQLNQEWNMGLEQAIEAEAQAQAICMQTRDFERAYRAFVAKEQPVFQGGLMVDRGPAPEPPGYLGTEE